MYNQAQLPLFPAGVTEISNNLSFKQENNEVVYFSYAMPIFKHAVDDLATFKMITSQFYITGNATQAEISRAFGVSLISLKRSVKLYREKGPQAFYAKRKGRGAGVLTADVLLACQDKLDAGVDVLDIAEEFGIKKNTLQKAILNGRLHKVKKKNLK
jgi:hypothetical protein